MRSRSSIRLAVLVFIFTSTFICQQAGAEMPFIYKSGGRKDPFVPLVSNDGKLMVTYGVINSIDDVVLEGIIYDPKAESIAVLNGLILKENDQVGSIKIKKIEKDWVILIYEDKEYTLKLKE